MVQILYSEQTIEYFLMVFIRVASFISIAPFFGTPNVPNKMKIGLSFFLSVILFSILPVKEIEYFTVIQYGIIVAKEAIVGLLIGFSANICTSIIVFAGRFIDMDIGFAMVTMFDPLTKQQASISGSFYQYGFLLIMIATNMHHFLLRALTDSYQVIPVNGMTVNLEKLYNTVMQFMTDYLVIGFRIALPIFATALLLNVILGILAKIAPQMNMFVIGMQLKVLIGLGVLFLIIVLLPNISDFIFTEMKKMMVAVIEGMSP